MNSLLEPSSHNLFRTSITSLGKSTVDVSRDEFPNLHLSEMISDDQLVQMQEMDAGDEENTDSFVMDSGVNAEMLGSLPEGEAPSARTIILAKRKPTTKPFPLPRSKVK